MAVADMATLVAMSAMSLLEWRSGAKKNLREIAETIGLRGSNPARTLHRYETGERACPLDVAIRIEALTAGKVVPSSFSETRSKHLSNSPRASADGENAAGCRVPSEPVSAQEARR
jgi:hypothetical protein